MLGAIEGVNHDIIHEMKRFQDELAETTDREEIKTLQEKIAACLSLLSEHVQPLMMKLMQGPSAEKTFDAIYSRSIWKRSCAWKPKSMRASARPSGCLSPSKNTSGRRLGALTSS